MFNFLGGGGGVPGFMRSLASSVKVAGGVGGVGLREY